MNITLVHIVETNISRLVRFWFIPLDNGDGGAAGWRTRWWRDEAHANLLRKHNAEQNAFNKINRNRTHTHTLHTRKAKTKWKQFSHLLFLNNEMAGCGFNVASIYLVGHLSMGRKSQTTSSVPCFRGHQLPPHPLTPNAMVEWRAPTTEECQMQLFLKQQHNTIHSSVVIIIVGLYPFSQERQPTSPSSWCYFQN